MAKASEIYQRPAGGISGWHAGRDRGANEGSDALGRPVLAHPIPMSYLKTKEPSSSRPSWLTLIQLGKRMLKISLRSAAEYESAVQGTSWVGMFSSWGTPCSTWRKSANVRS